MDVALKELEPFIKSGQLLKTGRPLRKLGGMLPREMLGNWLICAAISSSGDRRLSFSSDPTGGDGVIEDLDTHGTWLTEHVFVGPWNAGETPDLKKLILSAIEKKQAKGDSYASGKTLVVFSDVTAGPWHPNDIARELPCPLQFVTVWVVGLQKTTNGVYTYHVVHLELRDGNAPTYLVHICKDFGGWLVERLQ